ncbi:hypothetical protein JCM11641_007948 [Rhodosporidiobolus odoratus]
MVHHANKKRRDEGSHFSVGDKVYVSTAGMRFPHALSGTFIPRYVGPFPISSSNPAKSTYDIDLPSHLRIHNRIHSSKLCPHFPNDDLRFPSRALTRPPPAVPAADVGEEEYVIEKIVADRVCRGQRKFRVRYLGYSASDDEFRPEYELAELAPDVLAEYLATMTIRRSTRPRDRALISLFGSMLSPFRGVEFLARRIVSDRDRLFTSRFWEALHKWMGTRLQMSTAFHPETDGRSERTNKTAVQILRGMVSHRQTDWANHLALTEYSMNCAVNASTGKAPFEMVLGFVPNVSPALGAREAVPSVEEVLSVREAGIKEAQDALRWAKTQQTAQVAARRRSDKDQFIVVSLTLQLGADDKSFPKFHISKLRRYIPNDNSAFPERSPPRPEPIVVDGTEEFVVEKVVDERKRRGKTEYLVKWEGYPDAENTWEPALELEDVAALDAWVKEKGGGA